MHSLIILCITLTTATASVIPSYGQGHGSTGWTDYGPSKWAGGGGSGGYGGYHHVPVATSYASVWKVDHSVPVVYKPVVYKPVVKTYPSYGYSAWDTAPTYGGYGVDQSSSYGVVHQQSSPYGTHQQSSPYGHY